MLFSMQLLCFYKQPPLLFASLSPHLVRTTSDGIFIKDRKGRLMTNPSYSNSGWIVHAAKEDNSQQYEVDPVKAKEALQKLDQELQSLSNKQVSTPKLRVSDVKLTEEQANYESDKQLEISDSFLAYLGGGLILFTIFYNVLFYTVIKPSIDGS